MKIINYLLAATILVACGTPTKHKKHSDKTTVHSWKTKAPSSELNNSESDDFIYWYIIYTSMNNSNPACPCYSYSSPSPVTNFSSLNFTKTETLPEELAGEEEQQPVEVETTELPNEVETSIDENFDTNDSNEPDAAQEGSESGSESSDGGSSDGGSSDGGDAGGSDGGDGGSGGGD